MAEDRGIRRRRKPPLIHACTRLAEPGTSFSGAWRVRFTPPQFEIRETLCPVEVYTYYCVPYDKYKYDATRK